MGGLVVIGKFVFEMIFGFCLLNGISTTTGMAKCMFWLIQFLLLTGPVSTVGKLGRIITVLLVLTVLTIRMFCKRS